MYIFDFTVTTEFRIRAAIDAIVRGARNALRYYPFLAGRLKALSDSVDENLQLRYPDTITMGKIRELVKYKVMMDGAGNYDRLCSRNMPVNQWKQEDFCAAPPDPDPSIWQPAFTLQANFLQSGGLVLCFAFHHCVVDNRSIVTFLRRFSAGIQTVSQDLQEYEAPDISFYFLPDFTGELAQFPEWVANENHMPVPAAIEDRPANYVFIIDHDDALEWTQEIVSYLRNTLNIPDEVVIVDCLVAILWTEIIRAGQITALQEDRESRLHFNVNAREELIPPLDESYFGNMSVSAVATMRCPDRMMATDTEDPEFYEESLSIFGLATQTIRRAIERLSNMYARRRLTYLNNMTLPGQIQKISDEAIHCRHAGIRLSSTGSGADVEFSIPGAGSGPNNNSGRARFIRKPWMNDSEGEIVIIPRQEGQGGVWTFQVCLQRWQIESAVPLLEIYGFEAVKNNGNPS
ncbi:hypothetical protein F5Y02DRAFT_366599 [Annulohypoxylon stygium]|nr:hypothetical protein F5Y02DRAFT_366599 [Annulohypoxylon stygium]